MINQGASNLLLELVQIDSPRGRGVCRTLSGVFLAVMGAQVEIDDAGEKSAQQL